MSLLDTVLASLAQQGNAAPAPTTRAGGADLQALLMQVVGFFLMRRIADIRV